MNLVDFDVGGGVGGINMQMRCQGEEKEKREKTPFAIQMRRRRRRRSVVVASSASFGNKKQKKRKKSK